MGEILGFTYIFLQFDMDLPFLIDHSTNILVVLGMLIYKIRDIFNNEKQIN